MRSAIDLGLLPGHPEPMADGGQGADRPGDGGQGGGRGDRRREGEELARAALVPLGPSEWPPALLIAIGVCVVLAVAVLIGGLTIHNLSSRGGSLAGALFLAVILSALAFGMYRRRYLAVLGFEALLAFQIIVTSLALVVAATLVAAGACLLAICLGGWLFWKLVRVMGRIQAGEHRGDS